MAFDFEHERSGQILEVHVSGKLTKEDYERFTPEAERAIARHGTIRVLFDMYDFHGWKAAALWEDMKFGLRHFKDIDRIAIIGEKAWEHGLAAFCKPFTAAEIRYFDRSDAETGRRWLREESVH
jgi:hypothetical protein